MTQTPASIEHLEALQWLIFMRHEASAHENRRLLEQQSMVRIQLSQPSPSVRASGRCYCPGMIQLDESVFYRY